MSTRFPDPPSREDRLDELEKRVRRLEEAWLERPAASRELVAERVPAESFLTAAEGPAEPIASRRGTGALVLDVLAQTGWSVLALAGAFLVRALTDRGAMATTPGVALGLAYALGVIVLADRAAARGNRLTAGFLGSTGVFIANAIVAETTTRFGIFSVGAGLAVLAGATAVALVLGRRHDLPAVAWTATFAACGTAVFLSVASGAAAPAGLLLLLLATATLWLGLDHWAWRLIAWPPTLCAVALSLWATSAALTRSANAGTGPPLAMMLALGLALLWPGSVLLRTLMGRPQIVGIAIVQSLFALSVGLGGGILLAREHGGGAGPLAAVALVCGVGGYALAFLRERGPEAREGRLYWAWVGLALVLIGSGTLLPTPVPALLWSLLGLVAVAIARRFEPPILQAHGAVFAGAASFASGLLKASLLAFTAAETALAPADGPALLTLAVVTGVAVLLLRERPAAGPLPALSAALFSAMGLGAAAVLVLRRPAAALLAEPLPALRTVVLSVSAYILARLWRSTARKELRTLAYVALVAGGLKLLVQDLPSGTPITLFVAFVFYGGALLLVPRLMGRGPSAGR